jgi:hypothetical protein
MIKTKVNFPYAYVAIADFWLFRLGPLDYLLPRPFKLFGFPMFRPWPYNVPNDGFSWQASCALNSD